MTSLNNPAARLYALVEAGKSQKMDQPARTAWAALLGIPAGDLALLLRRISHVYTLPTDIEVSVKRVENINHELYLRWLPKVRAAFSVVNFDTQWQHFHSRFDGETLYGIQLCSDVLSRNLPEPIVNIGELEKLLAEITKLAKGLSKDSLPPEVYAFLYEHLALVRDAMEQCPVRGMNPLRAEVERVVGAVCCEPEIWEQTRRHESGRAFWTIMGRIAIVVTLVAGSVQIGNEVVNILEPAEAPVDADRGGAVPPNSNDEDEDSKVAPEVRKA